MTRPIQHDSTNVSIEIMIIDATDGTPEQAVEHDSSGLSLWYRRPGAAKAAITPASLASLTAAHSDGGIEHVDDGVYRLDLPDAAVADGVDHVVVGGTADGMIILPVTIALVDYDPETGATGTEPPTAAAVADAVWEEARADHTSAGSFGEYVNTDAVAAGNAETGHAVIPPVIERPDQGSKTVRFHLYLYSSQGNMYTPDETPTCAVENDQATDRSGNLGSVTADGTGHYYVDYTVADTHALEALTVEWSVVSDDSGYSNRIYAAATHVVDPLDETDVNAVVVAGDTVYAQHTAGETVYISIFNAAGNVFDFNDSTFKSWDTATTPYKVLDERSDAGGDSVSLYTTTLDLSAINSTGAKMELAVESYEQQGGSPSKTADPRILAPAEITVHFGSLGEKSVQVEFGVSYDTTGGTGAQNTAWLEIDGLFVDLATADPTATCTIDVREYGAGSDNYNLPASGSLNPNAAGFFEALEGVPNFTGDKTYVATVAVTTGGTTYTAKHKFTVMK